MESGDQFALIHTGEVKEKFQLSAKKLASWWVPVEPHGGNNQIPLALWGPSVPKQASTVPLLRNRLAAARKSARLNPISSTRNMCLPSGFERAAAAFPVWWGWTGFSVEPENAFYHLKLSLHPLQDIISSDSHILGSTEYFLNISVVYFLDIKVGGGCYPAIYRDISLDDTIGVQTAFRLLKLKSYI